MNVVLNHMWQLQMPKIRIQVKCHYSIVFPLFLFVLPPHGPMSLRETGSTALPHECHSNNNAPEELCWVENGTTAVPEPLFIPLFQSSNTYSRTLILKLTTLLVSSSSNSSFVSIWTRFHVLTLICCSLRIHSSFPILCPQVFAWLLPSWHLPETLVCLHFVTWVEGRKLILVSNPFCFCLRGKNVARERHSQLNIKKNLHLKNHIFASSES